MISRRTFIAATCSALIPDGLSAQQPTEPIIDLHQHTNYVGRSDEALVAHQRALGVQKTVLLPAGSKYGLAADCGGNDTVMNLSRKYPKEFFFFANELPDLAGSSPSHREIPEGRSDWHRRAEVPCGLRLTTYL